MDGRTDDAFDADGPAMCARLAPRVVALAQDCVIGGTICGSGDVAAQTLLSARQGGELDARRLGAMASYGFLAACPYHFWYKFLAREFPTAVTTKTVLECLIVVPCFEVPAVVLYTGVVGRGQSPQEAFAQLVADFWAACTFGLFLWAPTSVATFTFVHPRWHLTAFYAAGALWDCGISYLAFDASSAHNTHPS